MRYSELPPLSDEEILRGAQKEPEEGYPDKRGRLVIPREQWQHMVKDNEIIIPDHPDYHIIDHPNRKTDKPIDPIATIDNPMPNGRVQEWHKLGLMVDTAGRPLHPRAGQLLTTEGVGMYTGPGFHYTYGPQRMSNLGLRKVENDQVYYATVGVMRRGKLRYSLPGGYAEPSETSIEGAFREGEEETGAISQLGRRLGGLALHEVFSPPKGFKRDTLHAWGEEYFIFAESPEDPALEGVELDPQDKTEVVEAHWMTLEQISHMQAEGIFITTHYERILQFEQLHASNG